MFLLQLLSLLCIFSLSPIAGLSLGSGLGVNLSSRSFFRGTVVSMPVDYEGVSGENDNIEGGLVMRVSRRGSKMRGQEFIVSKLNEERKAGSGKRGNSNFIDPNKLFVGNLDFGSTEVDLIGFFEEHGYGSHVTSCKVITDWKTGKSKGYGFVSFEDPIFATSAMESLRNLKLKGRVVRLSQRQTSKTHTRNGLRQSSPTCRPVMF